MSKIKNFEKISLNFHLKHPGKGNEPSDPNAIFYINGIYHLHYILRHKWNGTNHNKPRNNFPFLHSHSFIHVTSKDMINWKWNETKLQPSFTKHGMFSGTGFITFDHKPAIIYHGENTKKNFIIIAKNNNLSKWYNPFPIQLISNKKKTKIKLWDPDCFIIDKTYYSISGGIEQTLFKSNNLKNWKHIGKFMKSDLRNVEIGEDISCPNFFKLKNKWVLLCISHSHGCRYYIGDWNRKTEKFIPHTHERMNWPNYSDSKFEIENRDFFAPESVKTPDGRRVMWSWMRMQGIKNLNILSLPRELDISPKGKLIIKPANELKKLRSNPKVLKNVKIKPSNNPLNIFPIKPIILLKESSLEIEILIKKKQLKQKRFGFKIFSKKKEGGFPIIFQPDSETIFVGNTQAPFNLGDIENTKYLKVRIFVDKFLIEVFVGDIQSVVGSYFDFKKNNYFSAFSFGSSLLIDTIKIWHMKSVNLGYQKAQKNKIWKIDEKN